MEACGAKQLTTQTRPRIQAQPSRCFLRRGTSLTEIKFTLSILQVYFICSSPKKKYIRSILRLYFRRKSINEVYLANVLHLYFNYLSVL